MPRDLYAVLGVPRTAEADAIKKAYRALAAKHHPDKNAGDAKHEAIFKEINHANDILSDAKKRALYDEFGEDGLREGFNAEQARAYGAWQKNGARPRGAGGMPGGVNLEDLFGGASAGGGIGDMLGDMFGGGGRARGGRRRTKGQDVEGEVTIDFAEAVRGTTVQLQVGPSSSPVTVRIPAGAEEGSRLRVSEQGGPAPTATGTRGDLYLAIHVRPHAHFRREGSDLHVDLPLTVAEAYLGTKIKVPTIDGTVTMKVPPRTQSAQKLRLRGKGIARRNQEAGDLYVHFQVRVPVGESPEITAAIEALAAAQAEDPREGIAL